MMSTTSAGDDVNIEDVSLALDDIDEYLFIERLKDVAVVDRLDYNCEEHPISSTGSTSKHDCSTDSYPRGEEASSNSDTLSAENQQSEREAIMDETKDTEVLEISSPDETVCRNPYDESPGSPEEHPVDRKTISAPISNGNMVHFYYCSAIFLICAGNLLLRMLDLSMFCDYLKPSQSQHFSTKTAPLATMAREQRVVQSLTHQQQHPSNIQNLILELEEVANNLLLRQETRESRLEKEIQKLVNQKRQLHNQLKKKEKLLERELKKGRQLKEKLQKQKAAAKKEREKWREVKKQLRRQHRTNVKKHKIQVKVERKKRRRLQKEFKTQEKLVYKERKDRRRLQEKLNKQEKLAQKEKTEQTQTAGKRQLQEKLIKEKDRLKIERKKRRDLEKYLKRLEWEYT